MTKLRFKPASPSRTTGAPRLGRVSAHRDREPSADDLEILMDVLENFLHDQFVVSTKRLDKRLSKSGI